MKTVLLFILMLLALPTSSNAAWWLWQLHTSPQQKQVISDNPVQFKLDSMQCGVTKTEFRRESDGSVSEWRYLYCQTAKDTKVSVIANCSYPDYEMHGLTIQKVSTKYLPALSCGPEKKP